MEKLTAKQQALYDFIQSAVEENGTSPSLREIGAHFGVSVGTVQDQVEAIRRKGFLEKERTKARGLRLPFGPAQIPILGRVHAGPLHAAIEDVQGSIHPGAGRAPSQHFALRVNGDSMIEAGILEGDLLVVRSQMTADEGDIVVALVEDEATVKTFRRRGGKPRLEPANPNYSPIVGVPFSIIGVVVELRRDYR